MEVNKLSIVHFFDKFAVSENILYIVTREIYILSKIKSAVRIGLLSADLAFVIISLL